MSDIMPRLSSIDCFECDAPIQHVTPSDPSECPFQLSNALVMFPTGGYGMYFDFLLLGWTGGQPVIILCEECARRMEEAFPNSFRELRKFEQETWSPEHRRGQDL